VYFRECPALGLRVQRKEVKGEGGWNYMKVVNPIVKGRINQKELGEK